MARLLPVAAVLAVLLTACQNEQPSIQSPPEVDVLAVQPQSLPIQKELVGRLAAFRSADVRARVPGVLQRRVYQEGQDVKQGDVLFTIDPAPFQAALAQAQAALAQAEANYANARVAAERAPSARGSWHRPRMSRSPILTTPKPPSAVPRPQCRLRARRCKVRRSTSAMQPCARRSVAARTSSR